MITSYIHRLFTGALSGVAVAAILLLPMAAAAEGEGKGAGAGAAVGEVSLLLGKAHIESAGQAREALKVGAVIHASDRIVTEANGHVHIRFVDDALVSVRPNSRLEITDYVYDAARPERSTVKFKLVEGVTRSISGEAGRSARERFRLDTPIAAIGVRGTDFVVSASQRNVRALVNEGSIVLAPYSEACLSGALGPCEFGGVELSGNTMQIVEIAQGQLQPVLRPRPEQELHELIDSEMDEVGREQESAVAKESQSDVYQESIAMRQVASQTSRSSAGAASAALPVETLRSRQLAWGRWAGAPEVQAGISLAYADAREGRRVTVGTSGQALFRMESGSGRVQDGLGSVGFDLDAAEAFHDGESGIAAMTVKGGDLRINFEQSTFSTSLDLDSAATGAIDFRSSGSLFSGGYFHNRGSDSNIAGAVSLDGKEAGYFFDQQIDSGMIRGTTLWGASE